jgi:formylglycine-generating enzyme required for sulfatase activity
VRFPQFIAVVWLALVCALASAHAEKRVALVIGNNHYANLAAGEQLQKAVNDARAVGAALKQIGFDVTAGENLGRQALLARIDETAQRLSSGDTVFFFFAGHGVAVDGLNYILPADVPAVGSGQIASLTGAAVKEEDISAALMRTSARVAVVVLDACRNNPFTNAGTRGVGGERGLAPHEPPSGVFTLYSAGRGEAALDRLYDGDSNPNSVFTRALLPALVRPDLDLPALAVEVRKEVARLARTVNRAQRPAYYDETSGDRIFLAAAVPGRASSAEPPASAAPFPPDRFSWYSWPSPEAPKPATAANAVVVPLKPAVPADPCSGPATATSRCVLTAAQERGLKPKDAFQECMDCPEMVVLPAGKFTMGSPKGAAVSRSPPIPVSKDDGLLPVLERDNDGPQHVVTIRKVAIGKLHVTVDQFAAFVKETEYDANPKSSGRWCLSFDEDYGLTGSEDRSWLNPSFPQSGSHPVVCVSWDAAKAYVDWLAKKTGKLYRLVSEAEWEYAATGRTTPGAYPRFWFGNDEKDLCRYGNFWDQKALDSVKAILMERFRPPDKPAPCNDGYDRTSPAGHYKPNAFGLYDMLGNADQWTADCWHDSYDSGYNRAPGDGSAWTTACLVHGQHVLRGGSWYADPIGLRSASRGGASDDYRASFIGFRVARTLTP